MDKVEHHLSRMELFRSLAHQEYALVESNQAQMFEDIAPFPNQFGEEGLRRHLVDFSEGGTASPEDVNAFVEAFLATTRRVGTEQMGFWYPDEIQYSLTEEFYDRYIESGQEISTCAPHFKVRLSTSSGFSMFLIEIPIKSPESLSAGGSPVGSRSAARSVSREITVRFYRNHFCLFLILRTFFRIQPLQLPYGPLYPLLYLFC